MAKEGDWDVVIRPTRSWLDVDLKGLWQYRDLVSLLVWRDLVAVYKQTVLGPLWHVVQPLLTTLTFALVFGKAAKLGPVGVPSILYYMAGVVPWFYFSQVVNKTSKTFIGQANIMSKVYFPRLAIPLSMAISNLIGFFIQLATLAAFVAFYHFFDAAFTFEFRTDLLLLPVLIVVMAFLGLSMGILVSALTTRYRDLSFLIGFLIQLLMYLSPVILPRALFQENALAYAAFRANPMTPVIDNFRAMFLGGPMDWSGMVYATVFTLVLSFIAVIVFNRVERSFADIV